MLTLPVLRWLSTLSLLVFAACPAPMPVVDAGQMMMVVDAGVPVACTKPESCRDLGFAAAVCRDGFCNSDVACGSDFECSLGERCTRGRCVFTGCTKDADCPTGRCLGDTYSCVECSANGDCPRDRPVCDVMRNVCQSCRTDAECTVPGPARCGPAGSCVHCLVNDDCPNGLTCGSGNVCVGVRKGQPCPMGTACGEGLSCVTLNGNPVCLPSCNLYQPLCETGELCYRLTYATSSSLVFESQGPIGVCFREQAGLRGARELCQRNTMGGSNCQPNLQCVPETASTSLCRTYCNPLVSGGGCVAPEKCVSFPGDFNGRRYGLCLPDNGFGTVCTRDGQCRANSSCQPYDDPSSSNDISNICQFNLGTSPGLSPCSPRVLTDGGVIPADLSCRSGACRGDPLAASSPNYFCYASCEQDSDCSIGGRTGFCDADFSFTTAFGTFGTVKGCRPECDSEASCSGYDAGVTCRVRLVSSATSPTLTTTCSPPFGLKAAGEPCVSSPQCRSGFCQLDDSRGARRQGVCLDPCTTASGCGAPAADAGVFLSLGCQPMTVLASRGFDGVANTNDDRLLQRRFCAGPACTTTEDCRGDAGVSSVCAPMVEPMGPTVTSLRCLPKTAGVKGAGETCLGDNECATGVCGTLQRPSTGAGSSCFEACTATSVCAAGTTCRVGGMRVTTTRGPVNVDSCAP